MPVPNITAREGRTLIAIGPFCWGKASTAKDAVRKMRENLSYSNSKTPVKIILIDAPPDAYVDNMGMTCWKDPDGTVPRAEQIADFTITRRR